MAVLNWNKQHLKVACHLRAIQAPLILLESHLKISILAFPSTPIGLSFDSDLADYPDIGAISTYSIKHFFSLTLPFGPGIQLRVVKRLLYLPMEAHNSRSVFIKHARNIGRAYRSQAIELISICLIFSRVVPQFAHEDADLRR